MNSVERLDQLVASVENQGYMAVKELSELFSVSEVTIRRDLKRLHQENRLRRTTGGAVPVTLTGETAVGSQTDSAALTDHRRFIDQVEVLIVSSYEPNLESILLDQARARDVPIIAEAVDTPGMQAMVSVNNYQAGLDLGQWAGHHAREHFGGQAFVLDLTYDMRNTQLRSQGFIEGLRQVAPTCEICLSADSQALYNTSYQLTTDALHVYPRINIIFAINDITAQGASQACLDLGIDASSLLILPFGLEGDTMKDELMRDGYCKAGLAMFPEIVGPICLETAIKKYQGDMVPVLIETPHAVLTYETLSQFYRKTNQGWEIIWGAVQDRLGFRLDLAGQPLDRLPKRVGLIIPFAEHEWYQNLVSAMNRHAETYDLKLEIISTTQTLREEIVLRRRAIAKTAARQIKPGDVIIVDHGEVTTYLAEELIGIEGITVITNSLAIFELLRGKPNVNLILTGGQLSQNGETLVGPMANSALRELCADRLFLAVDGVSLSFGLSHSNLEEVTVKQAMLQSAQEIVLLADHTKFKHTAIAHVAPITIASKLITDNALPASTRLELMKRGVEVVLARSVPAGVG